MFSHNNIENVHVENQATDDFNVKNQATDDFNVKNQATDHFNVFQCRMIKCWGSSETCDGRVPGQSGLSSGQSGLSHSNFFENFEFFEFCFIQTFFENFEFFEFCIIQTFLNTLICFGCVRIYFEFCRFLYYSNIF